MNFYLDKWSWRLGSVSRGKAIAESGIPGRKLEAVGREAALEGLKECRSALLYGNRVEADRMIRELVKGSDDLVALVNCEDLQEGHLQIAVRQLGKGAYGDIERLGFVPDLVVARCRNLVEACGLLEWTAFGTRLVCAVKPRKSEHRIWGIAQGFELQAFCCDDGAAIIGRKT